MDESLIGHEANFRLPCDDSVVPLLMGFIEELLMAGGSDIEGPERVEEQIRSEIDEICDRGGASGEESARGAGAKAPDAIEANLSIVVDGVELRLRPPGGESEGAPILVREE